MGFFFLRMSYYFPDFSFFRCLWGLSSLKGFLKSYDFCNLPSSLTSWCELTSFVKFYIPILKRNPLCSSFFPSIFSSFSVFYIKDHNSYQTALLQLQLVPGFCNCSPDLREIISACCCWVWAASPSSLASFKLVHAFESSPFIKLFSIMLFEWAIFFLPNPWRIGSISLRKRD